MFESFFNTINNVLGVPVGSSFKKVNGEYATSKGEIDQLVSSNELVNSVVDITANDVCITANPISLVHDDVIPESFLQLAENLKEEFNSIVKWVAVDLLKYGYSVYYPKMVGDSLKIFPLLHDVRIFLNSKKELVVWDSNDNAFRSDVLIFCSYSKSSLSEITSNEFTSDCVDELLFEITPESLQLKNIKKTIADLNNTEASILRYRMQLSRIVRFITVDVGMSQGDKQQSVVDTLNSSINSDSMSMSEYGYSPDFDDTIPIIPTRKGLGAPQLTTDVPNFEIDKLSDYDNLLSKLFLGMSFPKTYADVSQALSPNTVSLIKGDLRYARLVTSCRSIIQNTINKWVSSQEDLKKYNISYYVTGIPSSEDADLVEVLNSYIDLTKNAATLVDESSSKINAQTRLKLLQSLLGSSLSLPNIQELMDALRVYVEQKEEESTDNVDEF